MTPLIFPAQDTPYVAENLAQYAKQHGDGEAYIAEAGEDKDAGKAEKGKRKEAQKECIGNNPEPVSVK